MMYLEISKEAHGVFWCNIDGGIYLFWSRSILTWGDEWLVTDRVRVESLCRHKEGGSCGPLFCDVPITTPPSFALECMLKYEEVRWRHGHEIYMEDSLILPDSGVGRCNGIPCLPRAVWIQGAGTIDSVYVTPDHPLSIDICLSIVNSDVDSTYWASYVSSLWAMSYVWTDVMVASWDKGSRNTSPIIAATKCVVPTLEVFWLTCASIMD